MNKTSKYYVVREPFSYGKKFDSEHEAEKYCLERKAVLKDEGVNHRYSSETEVHDYPSTPEFKHQYSEMIKRTIINELINEKVVRFTECDWSDAICEKDGDRFAVFGDLAYKLLDQVVKDSKAGYQATWEPIIIDGKCFSMFPEEGGGGGILHLLTTTKRKGIPIIPPSVDTVFFSAGWVYARELDLAPQEVADNIAKDVPGRKAAITGGINSGGEQS